VLVGRKVLVTTTGGNAVVDVESDNSVPAKYSLEQNYPNPFNPATTIEYALPHAGHFTLRVYNALGEEVGTLVDGELPPGGYTVRWNAAGQPAGVYFYRLITPGSVLIGKAILLK